MFFCFFGAKIWPAAADTGELGWDLRDPTRDPNAGDHCQRKWVISERRGAFASA